MKAPGMGGGPTVSRRGRDTLVVEGAGKVCCCGNTLAAQGTARCGLEGLRTVGRIVGKVRQRWLRVLVISMVYLPYTADAVSAMLRGQPAAVRCWWVGTEQLQPTAPSSRRCGQGASARPMRQALLTTTRPSISGD